jgi:HSP20 family molecular chaperone IbpA
VFGRKYLQREQDSGPQIRVFEFPSDIDPDKTTAKLEHGMLHIQAPKATAARRKVVKLQQEA